ncbi:DMT family transporter [Rodentibacter trehalosifermentans]|uniref:QacE family quaternary ammonium compound efflux SMR transporter n=1 Tax=Rodentibacter trehalosifermentans TaxID=1908263 RepID=A0A1V3IS11_9PAST|nr:multidrug efflux SMR transporter [Rodentibacter trehalosifermentans]OOF45068.1 QacE family quaternary ammonium compound efflux SMR transporter [Rodentibacter trehalosifermentans]OOF52342.1 QacE family quaternary ammonium compound efflux SMR transporter [Rodentibacter trehalosifermentans]
MQLHWLFLALAIVSEVFASSMLKLSDGFSKTLPTVGVAVGFIISFYFLSLVLKTLPLGTAYAIWAGLGLVLTSVVSILFFGQKLDLMGIISIGLILLGVVLLNTVSHMSGH